jgi:hypothetical protein
MNIVPRFLTRLLASSSSEHSSGVDALSNRLSHSAKKASICKRLNIVCPYRSNGGQHCSQFQSALTFSLAGQSSYQSGLQLPSPDSPFFPQGPALPGYQLDIRQQLVIAHRSASLASCGRRFTGRNCLRGLWM